MTRAAEIGAFLAHEGWGWAERTPLAGDASARRYERLRRPGGCRRHPDGHAAGERPRRRGPSSPSPPGSAPAASARPRCSARTRAAAWSCSRTSATTSSPPSAPPARRSSPASTAPPSRRSPTSSAARRPGSDVGWTPPPYDMRLPDARGAAGAGVVSARRYRRACPARPRRRVRGPRRRRPRAGRATPPVPVLRDYHAENLLWLPSRRDHARVGMLDYQDMLLGHPAYDLVSLLEDARRDTGEALRTAMLARYIERSGADPRGLHRRRRRPRRPAQPEDPRALHPALPPRRQAALPRLPAAGLGATSPATSPTRRSRRSPPSSLATSRRPSRRCSPGSRPPHDPAGGDDLRRRPRHPHGRAHPRPAEAADRGRRAAAHRPRPRPRPRRRHPRASSSIPTPTPGSSTPISPGSRPTRWSRTSPSGSRPAAA